MAHKTFISYKFSDAKELRDRIIKSLGDDADFYQGETSESPDLTDEKTERIKNVLKDMIFGSSVTIVIISPHMTESKWIDWEISYSLTENSRNDHISHTNGLVGVIMKDKDRYDWIKPKGRELYNLGTYDESKLFPIISNNMHNLKMSHIYDVLPQLKKLKQEDLLSYIALVEQDEFLAHPREYIENAEIKSQSDAYDIRKRFS